MATQLSAFERCPSPFFLGHNRILFLLRIGPLSVIQVWTDEGREPWTVSIESGNYSHVSHIHFGRVSPTTTRSSNYLVIDPKQGEATERHKVDLFMGETTKRALGSLQIHVSTSRPCKLNGCQIFITIYSNSHSDVRMGYLSSGDARSAGSQESPFWGTWLPLGGNTSLSVKSLDIGGCVYVIIIGRLLERDDRIFIV